jgi:hypothetical protein
MLKQKDEEILKQVIEAKINLLIYNNRIKFNIIQDNGMFSDLDNKNI